MDIKEALVIILSGMVGTCGFALLFRLSKKRIPIAALGGALTCFIYALCCYFFAHEFFQNIFPALFITCYAEIMARVTKSPSPGFLVCGIIPLVPGSKLYYTMYYFIVSDMVQFRTCLYQLLRIVAGLAVGIILVSVIVRMINYSKFKQIYDIE